MDRTGFAGCDVWHGRGDESLLDRKSQRTTALGEEPLGWIRSLRRGIGTARRAGACSPLVTGFLPWLTALAAIGLGLIQVLAITTEHLPKKEFNIVPVNIILLTLSLFVTIGRWPLIS
jgi:hypothetical protein